ncbi:hypothetical protein N7456_007900 [Penicillium angulare]|uniref:Xylanolytic transcriptional activator regulatory domain-containing protein n=1 Tax=Penicillium angulare TaxID=116970 RepID=A0A9W9FBL2_9EURO|nr:hypothetical protein N7456_007900 [Penicillium angulare]
MNNGLITRLFGETSFYPIAPLVDEELDEDLRPNYPGSNGAAPSPSHAIPVTVHTELTPQSPVCQQAMSAFFQNAYYYHMVLYREYFLRDYKAGQGPYYSELLFYAIASMGALFCTDNTSWELSDLLYKRATELLYDGALNAPSITTVQALLLLGQRDVGCGNHTQGWLLTGLSFRMIHEMGLHLDPNHWKTSHDSEVRCEVLRRVYWACFIADKQLSLYFGRPPALHLSETDVHDSVRIAYPPDWDLLLNEYIMKDTMRTQYEDGIAFTSCFTQLANLSKIINRIITEIFEYRKTADASIQAASTHSVFAALTKWLADLPPKLHWNQWMKNTVPPYILHLHLYYHTVVILLCRPPRQIMSHRVSAFKQSFEICEQSLGAVLHLFEKYAKDYDSKPFPMTCLHTIATVVSIILLKLQVPGLSNDMNTNLRQLELISDVVDHAASTWPSAGPIHDIVNDARRKISEGQTSEESISYNWENLMTLDWQLDPNVELGLPTVYEEQTNFEV